MTPSLQWLQKVGGIISALSFRAHLAHVIAMGPVGFGQTSLLTIPGPHHHPTQSERVGTTSHATDTQEAHQCPKEGMSLSPGG